MRSNNAFVLLPYNVFEFSLLSEAIAAEVGLALGSLFYHALSMHVYSEDYARAEEVIVSGSTPQLAPFPKMPNSPTPMAQIHELVLLEAEARHGAAGFSSGTFDSKWLAAADNKLDEYWCQFYYLLLLAMCKQVGFHAGMMRFREFINEPWLNYLPSERSTPPLVILTRSTEQPELFDKASVDNAEHEVEVVNEAGDASDLGGRQDSTTISREELERELDDVLNIYKPTIAESQWAFVLNYRTEFIEKALATSDRARKVIERLRTNRVPLEKREKVLNSRGPAKPLIERLENMLR